MERRPFAANTYRAIRAEWEWCRMKPESTPFGFRLAGNRSMQNGQFEPEETRLIRSHLPDCDVFVDVGANIGFYSCLARSVNKHVVAIEPVVHNQRILYRNLELNGWPDVEVWPIAVAAVPGMINIYGGGTAASIIEGWSGISANHRQVVPVSTLDTLLGTRYDSKRLLIKIDVEGAEFDVLRGAERTLRSQPRPVWLVETTLSLHHPGINSHFCDVFDLFWTHGYEAVTADADQRVVTDSDVRRWLKTGVCDFGTYNWIFREA